MTSQPAITDQYEPVLMRAEPQLFVTDMERAVAYFTDVLGFSVAFLHGEPAFYGQVRRGGAVLNLRHVDEPVIVRGGERDLLSASITVDRLEPLFLELEGRGAMVHEPLTRQPWHSAESAEFMISDPDGNLILFAGSLK